MPLTTLDTNAALIVVDLQKGFVGLPTAHPIGEVIARNTQLARAFRRRDLPVVLVNATGRAPGRTDLGPRQHSSPEGWADLLPELEQQLGDHLISKQRVGAFIGTSLHELLHRLGVTQVFVTGVSSSAGVEATVRSAYDYGYDVVVVVDAITDLSLDSHRYSVDKVFPGSVKRIQPKPYSNFCAVEPAQVGYILRELITQRLRTEPTT